MLDTRAVPGPTIRYKESPEGAEPTPEILRALERVTESETLKGSERLCRFLRYSVEAELAGRSHNLNQYVLGVDVFDKPESFDPTVDPIVRVEAARLREKLDLYYAGEGAYEALRFRFASRGYATSFERIEAAELTAQPSQSDPDRKPASNGASKASLAALEPPLHAEVRGGDRPVSMAVLPFVDLSPQRDQDAFCDGITVELINQLAAVEGLRLLSRTSSYQFKDQTVDVREVGRKLGVDALLEGSVRRYPEGCRISAQLSDSSDGFLLWAGSYTTKKDDPLEVQTEVVESITSALNDLLERRRTSVA